MTRLTRPSDIRQLGTILAVFAHPDDETYTCGGILTIAVANGQRVVCVTATKGENGVQDAARWPAATLGEVRAAELQAALDILGVSEHRWLGYADGRCAGVPVDEAAAKLAAIMHDCRPDSILSFGPDGLTGHPDHQAVSAWVEAAVTRLEQPPAVYQATDTREQYEKYFKAADEQLNIYFNIAEPHCTPIEDCAIYLSLPPATRDQKFAAFRAMPSQMEKLLEVFGEEGFKDAFGVEAFARMRSS